MPMIKLAFFDVGETLIHAGLPFSGVPEALTAIEGLRTATGEDLLIGIISDYHMPLAPVTEEKIAGLEEQYRREVLVPSNLMRFFEPFDARVTLSSRAGVRKPERKIFEVAVARTGIAATFLECLFVTENVAHLEKCSEYGITPVHFGPDHHGPSGFADWADAPLLIADLIAPGDAGNHAAASAAELDIRHGLAGFEVIESSGQRIRGRANQLLQLNDSRLGPLNGVFIERPSEVRVELRDDGRISKVTAAATPPDEVEDAINFVFSLIRSGRVAIPGQPAPIMGATHAIETDSKGRMKLVRRGYSQA